MSVVIIGSGAGGGASAWALAQQGIRVLVLEAGPDYDPYQDYRLHRDDWELGYFPAKQRHKLQYSFATLQSLASRYDTLRSWNKNRGLMNPTDRRKAGKYHHVQGVGGSTLHFTGEAHRLHPQAFRMRSRFGVAADWPFSYEELESDYVTAEQIVGVAGLDQYSQRPRSAAFPLQAHPLSYASQRVVSTSQQTGLRWDHNPLAALSEPYDDRPGCNYCNNCNKGCPRRDKGSVDVTFLHKARQSGYCEIKSGCTVLRVVSGNNDRVKGVEYVDEAGERQWVPAEIVIVACGAVETPRLLLLSEGDRGQGLANESGLVGKNFMETLYWASSGLHSDNLGSYRGLPADLISWTFNAPDAIPGVIGGCRFNVNTGETGINGPVNYAVRAVPGWGLAHKRRMREAIGHALSIGAIGESLPNSQSYITLDRQHNDRFDRPIAQIHSYLEQGEIDRLMFMAAKCREILAACGITELFEEYGAYDIFNTTHVFGTARMGDDPNNSVVNGHCRSHRWKNLFIVDASVFPSSGGGESPSLTIEALAIRTARYIRNNSV